MYMKNIKSIVLKALNPVNLGIKMFEFLIVTLILVYSYNQMKTIIIKQAKYIYIL